MSLLDNNKSSKLRSQIEQGNIEKQNIKDEIYSKNLTVSENEKDTMLKITRIISERFKEKIAKSGIDNASINKEIIEAIKSEISDLDIPYEDKIRLEKITISNVIGLGPIEAFRQDKDITEIVVERYDKICVEKGGKIYKTDASFIDEEHLQNVINRIIQPVGRQININSPIVDARLVDGSRINATIPPVSPDGATLTIRKFDKKMLSSDKYIKNGSISKEMLYFLAKCVEGKINIIISGGTGSGKTTFLNMLSSYIPKDELIVTVEDSCELQLKQPHVRRLETRNNTSDGMLAITIQSLVKNCLRMRPDRVIVGEKRDGSIVDVLSAMSTGHEGSMSTIHSNSPANCVNSRIPVLFSMYKDASFSEESRNIQMAEAINLIVQLNRFRDGKRRITHITAVDGIDSQGHVCLQDIFRFDTESQKFVSTGYIPDKILNILNSNGVAINESILKGED